MISLTSKDFNEMQKRYRATFFNSLSGFKSLSLISTKGKNGVSNLAPFNSIIHIGANPPLIGMIARPETDEHQTLKNIRESGFYTMNHVNGSIMNQAHLCSAKFDAETSEFTKTGLTEYYSEHINVPYVSESNIKIGLQLESIIPIPLNNTSLVIGRIIEVIINESNIEQDGYVKLDDAGTIACAGLDSYFNVEHLARLPYATTN
jgi:flavin reductase (DIM6/NTAB) family NADH-FMN oxidoreductase RutF